MAKKKVTLAAPMQMPAPQPPANQMTSMVFPHQLNLNMDLQRVEGGIICLAGEWPEGEVLGSCPFSVALADFAPTFVADLIAHLKAQGVIPQDAVEGETP